jgi:hypothetical protein
MEKFVTKLEFSIKLEEYNKKQNRYKWGYALVGIVLTTFAFFPNIIMFFNEDMFGLPSIIFAVFGGYYLNKAWCIIRGTQEHELLIHALNLLTTRDKP